ncbi:MAG: hypothetical protein PHS64_04035 [Candidatus Omnitrophica bacterium]|nr:hypothetical protein [Candidatus Omnitrophota bacterium]
MERIKFDSQDTNFSEIIRSIMFDRLRKGAWQQLNLRDTGFDEYFEFGSNTHAERDVFMLMVQEIFWQFIAQGIITPGIDVNNPGLPWFRLTEYGRKVIQENRFLPHDPTNYIQNFKNIISNPDPIVVGYLEESLRCFTSGCLMAATMMLGIASEVVFLNLCDILLKALKDPKKKKDFAQIMHRVSIIAKFEFVQEKIEDVLKQNKQCLPEDAVITLLSVFNLIRTQRNDVGHPQGSLPALTRDQVFVYLRMFPQYCQTVQSAEVFLVTNKV